MIRLGKETIRLGMLAKDKVTGFKGIIVGKAEYLSGCTQYGIAPRALNNGKRGETEWIDEGRIVILGRGVRPHEVKVKKDGGPNRDCPGAN